MRAIRVLSENNCHLKIIKILKFGSYNHILIIKIKNYLLIMCVSIDKI